MKIILLDAPSWALFDPKMHLALSVLYLGGALREAGFDVEVWDAHKVTTWDAKNKQLTINREALAKCDVLGVSTTTANVKWGSELAAAWPAKYKVLGGSHVTQVIDGPHERFKIKKNFEGFDYLLTGEAEQSLVALCKALELGQDPTKQNIGGLVWFGPFGMQRLPTPALPDVTKLPGPAFDLWRDGFSRGALSSPSLKGKEVDGSGMMTASLFTSRGCPYGCKFCSDARTKVRDETFEQIEKEVKQLAELGVQAIRIQDDVYTIKEERAKGVADILHNYGMLWRGTTRVNLSDPKLFKYLAEKGCTELGFGIEHGSAKMLKAMDKGTTPEKNEIGIKMAQDAGIVARAFTMIGFPGETEETLEEFDEWLFRVKPDSVTLSIFTPYPGGQVWNDPERFGVKLPENPFGFWQLGFEDGPENIMLELPTISKERIFWWKNYLVAKISHEIGSLRRAEIHGNVGTFGKEEMIAGHI